MVETATQPQQQAKDAVINNFRLIGVEKWNPNNRKLDLASLPEEKREDAAQDINHLHQALIEENLAKLRSDIKKTPQEMALQLQEAIAPFKDKWWFKSEGYSNQQAVIAWLKEYHETTTQPQNPIVDNLLEDSIIQPTINMTQKEIQPRQPVDPSALSQEQYEGVVKAWEHGIQNSAQNPNIQLTQGVNAGQTRDTNALTIAKDNSRSLKRYQKATRDMLANASSASSAKNNQSSTTLPAKETKSVPKAVTANELSDVQRQLNEAKEDLGYSMRSDFSADSGNRIDSLRKTIKHLETKETQLKDQEKRLDENRKIAKREDQVTRLKQELEKDMFYFERAEPNLNNMDKARLYGNILWKKHQLKELQSQTPSPIPQEQKPATHPKPDVTTEPDKVVPIITAVVPQPQPETPQATTTAEQPSSIATTATPLLVREQPQATPWTTNALADTTRKALAQSRTAATEETPASAGITTPAEAVGGQTEELPVDSGWKSELPKEFQRELTFDGKTYTFVAGIDLGIEDAGYVGKILRYTSPSGDIAVKVSGSRRPACNTGEYEIEKLLRNELHLLEKINKTRQSWFPKPVGIIERSGSSLFAIAVSFCEGKNLNSRGFLEGLTRLERLYIAGELLKAFETARNAGVIVMDWKMKDVLVNVKNSSGPQTRFNMGLDVHYVDANVGTETESQNDYFLYQELGTLWSRIIKPLIADGDRVSSLGYLEYVIKDDKLREMESVLSPYNTQPNKRPKFPEFTRQLKDRLDTLFNQQLQKERWKTPEQEGADQDRSLKDLTPKERAERVRNKILEIISDEEYDNIKADVDTICQTVEKEGQLWWASWSNTAQLINEIKSAPEKKMELARFFYGFDKSIKGTYDAQTATYFMHQIKSATLPFQENERFTMIKEAFDHNDRPSSVLLYAANQILEDYNKTSGNQTILTRKEYEEHKNSIGDIVINSLQDYCRNTVNFLPSMISQLKLLVELLDRAGYQEKLKSLLTNNPNIKDSLIAAGIPLLPESQEELGGKPKQYDLDLEHNPYNGEDPDREFINDIRALGGEL